MTTDTPARRPVGDEPVAGYYKVRLVKGGPFVGVRLYYGQPEIDGEPQDRAPRWCAVVDGRTTYVEKGHDGYRCTIPLDPFSVWPWCGRWPISEADYRYMVDKSRWAKAHSPDRPEAAPREKIDPRGKSVW